MRYEKDENERLRDGNNLLNVLVFFQFSIVLYWGNVLQNDPGRKTGPWLHICNQRHYIPNGYTQI